MDKTDIIDKIRPFVVKYKMLILAFPLAIVFLSYTVSSAFNETSKKDAIDIKGYNKSLPYKNTGVEIENPNDLYKNSVRDSLRENNLSSSKIRRIGEDKEVDSLEAIIEKLEKFSFNEKKATTRKKVVDNVNVPQSPPQIITQKTVVIEKEKANQNDIFKYAGKSNSVPNIRENKSHKKVSKIRAVINKEVVIKSQGEQVQIRLLEDLRIKNNLIKKGTLLYGFSRYGRHRMFVEISNISGIDLNVKLNDGRDKNEGIYIKGGNLIPEATNTVYNDIVEEGVSSTDKKPLRNLGNIIRNNKAKLKPVRLNLNHSLILIINDDEN